MKAKSSAKKLAVIFFFSLFTIHCSLFTAFSAETPKRIISLAPNMTEILFSLGLGDNIVGVTSFCDYPEEAKKKPKIGGMSNPSLEAVISLKPDLVVLTTDGNPKEFEARLREMKIKTYVFRSRRIAELPKGIRDLGAAIGISARAEELANTTEKALEVLKINKAKNKTTKKVLFIVWPEPLIAAGPGTVINDAIQLIGAENIASGAKASYPKYSIEEIFRRSPDIIFIGKGVGMDKVSEGLLGRIRNVPAVKSKQVFFVSDDLYRLGPRTMRGIEEIAGLMR